VSAKRPAPKKAAGVRLQKLLAGAGVASRRKAEELIRERRVRVDGRVVDELGTKVDPSRQRVTLDGQSVEVQGHVYIVLNKPDGVVASAERDVDARGRPTVVSLLRGVPERVYPVGRLDYHTRGALLLTNDGALASRLTHPRHGVPRTYHAKLQGIVGVADLRKLESGVTLDDGTRTRPLVELAVFKETGNATWCELTLTQGLNRQVRRMGEAIGHPVLKLIRVAFAEIGTDGLREGEWRRLREDEVARLRELVGLSGQPRPSPSPSPSRSPSPRPAAEPRAGAGARRSRRPAAKGARKRVRS
jgi:23S rRNA pseudouridine2605 synthase